MLLFSDNTPEILHQILMNIDNRYMILESVLIKDEGYHNTKVIELMKIVDSILDEQKKPFTFFLTDIARTLLQSNASQKECIDALKVDLKTAQDKLGKGTQDKLDKSTQDKHATIQKENFLKQLMI